MKPHQDRDIYRTMMNVCIDNVATTTTANYWADRTIKIEQQQQQQRPVVLNAIDINSNNLMSYSRWMYIRRRMKSATAISITLASPQ